MSAGEVFGLIRAGAADTRAELGRLTGLSRTAVTARVEQLVECGLVVETAAVSSTGGRPPARLAFNTDGGVVLAAALGASRSRLAVHDLAGTPIATGTIDVDFAEGPDRVLSAAVERLVAMVAEVGRVPRGIGVSVPSAVGDGRGVSSAVAPAWGEVRIADRFADGFGVPVRVDNDVNALAIAVRREHPEVSDLLVVKVSTGIGAGIVAGGRLVRGAFGVSGEIGHVAVAGAGGARCRCGNRGCLESVAAGWALVEAMAGLGRPVADARAVGVLARAGDADAARLVRDAGRQIGEVVAGAVTLLNPALVVVSGDLAEDALIAGVREVVYQSATALATRDLRVERGTVGATRAGCAIMILEEILSPDAVNAQVSQRSRQVVG